MSSSKQLYNEGTIRGFVSKQDTSYTYKSFVIFHVFVIFEVIITVEIIFIVVFGILFLSFPFISTPFLSKTFFVRIFIILVFAFLVFDIGAQYSNLIILVFLEIEPELLSEPQL
jgi:hypothetical protein